MYYVVLKRGEIYQLDIETGEKSKIIDYSDKVSILGEGGMLLSLIHISEPTRPY